ncbi:hypothetical protein LSTR_LSTR000947 [Laodelphax striatellus]|uniref:C2H2-type domain-containing protein n=1 Tax=Laodelphax striatellus TaxID=195883 RepID=A0A482X1H6_LAOST|nr:hypothetical protein LSTR_LSTR000947 [Laodelphax striatellus]
MLFPDLQSEHYTIFKDGRPSQASHFKTSVDGDFLYCDGCERRFKLRKHLNYHKRHQCGITRQCNYCPFTTSSKLGLKLHLLNKHSNIANFGFMTNVMLLGEEYNKPLESFKCKNCGKMYRYKGNLQAHLRIECGKEPSMQCPYCPHKTKKKNNLKAHIAVRHLDMINSYKN